MAKQYIPGISGLLTEPNPADSPSNTLSEAENVVVEQRGKIQARHGFNIDDKNRYSFVNTSNSGISFNNNLFYTASDYFLGRNTCLISKTSTYSCIITIPNHGLLTDDYIKFTTTGKLPDTGLSTGLNTTNTYKIVVIDSNSFYLKTLTNYAVDIGTAEQYGTHTAYYRLRVGYIDTNTVDYPINQYEIINSEKNNAFINSFFNSGDTYFKFLEFKNSKDTVITGLIVKQNRNEYVLKVDGAYREFLVNRPVTDPVFRYYQISKDSTKIINTGTIPFTKVENIFKTDESLYLQTENGLVESNLDDLFRPTNDRFFKVKWPNFVKLKHKLIDSDLFGNWLLAGKKIGVRYVFYRETGYNQNEGNIYYSEPSQIYEIVNDGKNAIPQIYLDFSTIINNPDEYKKWNLFTQYNNGRKFGIIIYRTVVTDIADNEGRYNPLPVEFYACTDKIPFDTLITSEIQTIDLSNNVSFLPHRGLSIYRPIDTRGEYSEGDILSYIPNNKSNSGLSLSSGYVYSKKNVRFKEDKLDLNDIIPAQVKVSKKIKDTSNYAESTTNQCYFSESDTLYSTNEIRLNYGTDGTTAKKYYYGTNYKNCEKNSEFINTVIIRLKQEFKNALFNTGKIGVEIWEYDEKSLSEYQSFPYPRLINKIGSAEISMTDYPLNLTSARNAAYASELSTIFPVPYASTGLSIESSGNVIAEYFYNGSNSLYPANNLFPIIINGVTYTVTFPDTNAGAGTQYTAAQIVTQINSVLGANGTASIVNLGGSSTSILRITATTGSIRLSSGSANSVLKFGNFQTTAQDDWNILFKLEKNIEFISNKSYMIVLYEDSLYEADFSGSFYTRYAQFYYKTALNYSSQKYDVMSFRWSELTVPTYNSVIFYNSDTNPLTKYAFGFARIEPVYKYQLTAVNDITTQNTPATTLSTGTLLSNDKGALWKDRYFIKSYNFDLSLNDDAVIALPVIYTDANKDAEYNEIAPIAKAIIPFKDFYIYAGITEPLTATIYPVDQPYVSQIKFGLKTSSNIAQNGFQFANRNEFVTTGRTLPDLVIDSSLNGEVYLDSSIFPDKSVNVKVLTSTDLKTTNYAVAVNHYDEANDSIPIQVTNLNAATLTPANVASYFEIEGTVFEKPYVTLRLTSRSGKVDIVSVQVEPIYNRRGYYSKKNELNESDDNHLQFNLSLNEANAFKYTATDGTVIIERQGLTVHNVAGNGNNQLKPAGTHKQTAYNITDSNVANKIYLANNIITLRAIDTFDITQFQSPGILMIQRAADSNNISDVAIFDYAIVRVSSSNSNYIEFVGATLKYVTLNGIPQDIATAKNGTIIAIDNVSLYYLTGTTIQNLELYAYNTPQLNSAAVEVSSTGTKKIVERYNRDYFSRPGNTTNGQATITNILPSVTGLKLGMSVSGTGIPSGATITNINAGSNSITISANATATNTGTLLTFISTHVNQPTFTFAKHNKKTDNTVGKFADTGNHLFYGNYGSFGLDEYGWQLVNKFNKEFDARGINAICRKVPGLAVGGFQIEYPDGAKIEMVNGKYEIVNNQPTITYPGKHTFIPDINKKRFATLAEYSPSQYRSNVALVSRRDLPEVITSNSDIVIGRGDKEYIGYAKQVDDLYVFREDGIYRITDEGSKNPPLLDIPSVSVTQFSTNVICQAAGSIQEINDEIIFLSQFGFTSIKDGGIDYIISEPIKADILKLLETSPKDRIRSFANASKNLYYCTLVNEVDQNLDVKTGTYVFNTVTREWTFTDNEILDGMEDTEHRNLVAYKQKSINATITGSSQFRSDVLADDISFYVLQHYSFSYPLTISNKYNNFYTVSREYHTNGISTNALDQYDFISKKFDLGQLFSSVGWKGKYFNATGYSVSSNQFKQIIWKTNGFRVITIMNGLDYLFNPVEPSPPYNYYYGANRGAIFSTFLPKSNSMSLPLSGITTNQYTSTAVVFDSFIQYFYNRDVKVKFYSPTALQDFSGTTETYSIKLTNVSYDVGSTQSSDPKTVAQMYMDFDFISSKPSWWDSTMLVSPFGVPVDWKLWDNFGYMIDGFEILAGIPVKITFNPESANAPDTNKLFQEYMVHTETNNKAMTMAFKTDSRVNFTGDRRFAYDAAATKRNVFRTYIPTDAARGRYLIRQVKHDVPLENLIITGQTIVMRDTSSTRVQKDKD